MKAENSCYNKHFLALSALFVLGNAVITTPYDSADKYNFLGFIIACGISVAVYFIFSVFTVNKFTLWLVWLLSFYCIGDTFITFICFIKENLLLDTKPFLIAIPILLILLYIAFKDEKMLFKFSLISFFVTAFVIVFFFFATAKDFNVKNIFIYSLPSVNNLLSQLLPYIKSIVLPIVLLAPFSKLNNIKKSVAFYGLVLGFLCLGLCILNSVLLFGIELSGRLDYPYSSAGSTVTFGNLFTRMDGFLYFVYLSTCIAKCAVGIFAIKKSRELIP